MSDRPGLIGRLWYDVAWSGALISLSLGFSLRRRGWKNVPRSGPLLIVSNHQSMLDPVAVGVSCRRYLSFLARSTLFAQPVLGPLIRSLNSVPIDRGFGKEGIQSVLHALSLGRAVLVFPEGERSHTDEVQPLKPGISLLIRRVACPIVPAGIAGSFAAWNRFMTWPRFSPAFLPPGPSTIGVNIGEPIDPARYQGKDRDWIVEDLHRELVAQHAAARQVQRK